MGYGLVDSLQGICATYSEEITFVTLNEGGNNGFQDE